MLGSAIFSGGLLYGGWLVLELPRWNGSIDEAVVLGLDILMVGLRLAAGVLLWRLDSRGVKLQIAAVVVTTFAYVFNLLMHPSPVGVLVTGIALIVGLCVAALLRRRSVRPAFDSNAREWSLRSTGLGFWLLHVVFVLGIAIAHVNTVRMILAR
jgi:hypothetical protein